MEKMVSTELDYYKGKKVLVTGHTGFKGSWLIKILSLLGAEVTGYSLPLCPENKLFPLLDEKDEIVSVFDDIRNLLELREVFQKVQPQVVFHLAAQPLVRESYIEPRMTYEVNVMGTINVLECIKDCESVESTVIITTDKVYKNREWCWGYREDEELFGYDPYSNSKSCAELVCETYRHVFMKTPLTTVRAGNVIGGGDFAKDRIIPDCMRSALAGENIKIRNPHSIRPYQHVLEPLFAYLMIAKRQTDRIDLAGSYNIGPQDKDCITTEEIVRLFLRHWNGLNTYEIVCDKGPHEATFLKLDCSLAKQRFAWKPIWNIETAVQKTVDWIHVYHEQGDINACMNEQIEEYIRSAYHV